jgi:hypothetical protein
MAFNKSKGHPPIGTNRDRHEASQLALKQVQVESRKIHILQRRGCIQAREDIAQFHQMFRHNAPWVVVLIEAFQSLVAKGLNH